MFGSETNLRINQFIQILEFIRHELGGDYAPQQLTILLLASRYPGIVHSELAQRMNMPQPSISRNVKKLAQGYGLVENRIDPVVTRAYGVHLTQKGKDFVQQIIRQIT